jgi:hypothetical protein
VLDRGLRLHIDGKGVRRGAAVYIERPMHMRGANDTERLGRGRRYKGDIYPISAREVGDGADGWAQRVSESMGGSGSGRGGGTGLAQLGEPAAGRSTGEK